MGGERVVTGRFSRDRNILICCLKASPATGGSISLHEDALARFPALKLAAPGTHISACAGMEDLHEDLQGFCFRRLMRLPRSDAGRRIVTVHTDAHAGNVVASALSSVVEPSMSSEQEHVSRKFSVPTASSAVGGKNQQNQMSKRKTSQQHRATSSAQRKTASPVAGQEIRSPQRAPSVDRLFDGISRRPELRVIDLELASVSFALDDLIQILAVQMDALESRRAFARAYLAGTAPPQRGGAGVGAGAPQISEDDVDQLLLDVEIGYVLYWPAPLLAPELRAFQNARGIDRVARQGGSIRGVEQHEFVRIDHVASIADLAWTSPEFRLQILVCEEKPRLMHVRSNAVF